MSKNGNPNRIKSKINVQLKSITLLMIHKAQEFMIMNMKKVSTNINSSQMLTFISIYANDLTLTNCSNKQAKHPE